MAKPQQPAPQQMPYGGGGRGFAPFPGRGPGTASWEPWASQGDAQDVNGLLAWSANQSALLAIISVTLDYQGQL